MLGNIIENRYVDFCALFYFFNLSGCFNNCMVGNNMALTFNFFNSLVKINVAFFIFFTASTPAFIISAGFFHTNNSLKHF